MQEKTDQKKQFPEFAVGGFSADSAEGEAVAFWGKADKFQLIKQEINNLKSRIKESR